ncbi:MAG: hypothetical protein KDB14_17395 [Planctomycetales bacterium]|nr:hypothetical protein [Planctomycetales bacterium]
MLKRNNDGFRLLPWALLGLAWVCQGCSGHSAEQPKAPPEHRPTTTLEQSIQSEDFGTTTSDLAAYRFYLGDDFPRCLAELDGNDHWIDGGSGDSIAVEEYLSPPPQSSDNYPTSIQEILQRPLAGRARVTAITVTGRELANTSRLRLFHGRYFEDIPLPELLSPPFGKARLITDAHGVLTYTPWLDKALRKYLELLEPAGTLLIGNVSMCRTVIADQQGRLRSLPAWLETIPGLSVTRPRQDRKREPGPDSCITVRLSTGDLPEIPELTLLQSTSGPAPSRLFIVGGSPESKLDIRIRTDYWRYLRQFPEPYRKSMQDDGR